MKIKHILLLTFVASLLFTSCRSQKKASTGSNEYTPSVENAKIDTKATFKSMASGYGSWTDVQMPVKVRITSPKNISFSGTAKMQANEKLSMSLRFMGLMEVASLYADHDSVIVVSKPMGIYCAESLTRFKEIYGLSLADIQSLLLGQAFIAGNGAVSPKDADKFNLAKNTELTSEDAAIVTATPKQMPEGLEWNYNIITSDDADAYNSSMNIRAGSHSPITCTFVEPSKTPAGKVTSVVGINTRAAGQYIACSINWSLDRASWNEGVEIEKPRISGSLRRIAAEKVLEILKNV